MNSKEAVEGIRSRVKDVFRMYDASGDGELDSDELSRAIKVLGPSFTSDDIAAFGKEIDKDGGGTITFMEFFRWIRGDSKNAKAVFNAIYAAGDARATKIQDTFRRCDQTGDGSLDMKEMEKMLRLLGPFSYTEVKHICEDLDKSKDGEISYDEFVKWFKSDNSSKQITKAKAVLAPTDEDGLEGIFYNFCGAGQVDMDNSRFHRMCVDSGLINMNFTKSDVDRIWNSARVRPEDLRRRIGFQKFEISLELIADKKGVPADQVRSAVCKAERPVRKAPDIVEVAVAANRKKGLLQKIEEREKKQRSILLARVDYNQAPPDNSELWRLFGSATPAGRVLKQIYSPRQPPSPRQPTTPRLFSPRH